MKNRTGIHVIIGLLILLLPGIAISAGMKPGNPPAQKPPVQVVAVIPETGPLADIGETEKLGITLALEDAEANGSKALTMHYEDSNGKGPAAVSAVQKRLNFDKDRFFIITTTTPVLATLPLFRDLKDDVFVLAQTMYPHASLGFPFSFTIYPSSQQEVTLLADYALRKGYKKVAVLAIQNDWGTRSAQSFKEILNSGGGIVTAIESYTFADKDFRTILKKVLDTKPDAILIYAYPSTFPTILKQYSELGSPVPLLANADFAIGTIIKDIPDQVLGNTVFPAPRFVYGKDNPAIIKFNDRVKKSCHTPTFDIAAFYDMAMILNKAVNNAKERTPASVREALIALFPYEGITGHMELTPERGLTVDYVLSRWVNGNLEPIR